MDAFALILRAVRQSLDRTGAPAKILLGLSGGADSTALLLALHALREEGRLQLTAVHVNHGLREVADADEAFCRDLCTQLSVPLIVKRVQVSPQGSLEAAARAARYAAFHEAMTEAQTDTLALAHHMDDQAETVLLHLLHGAGVTGLGGMAEYRAPLWRPLLSIRRETIRGALQELGQPWREDESNADTAYTRNLIRARILPVMEEAFPQAVPVISRAGEILRTEDAFIEELTPGFLKANSAAGHWRFLMAEPLKAQHLALQRRIVRDYAARSGLALDLVQTDALCALIDAQPGASVNLPSDWHAQRTQERIHFIPPEKTPFQWQTDCLRVREAKGETGDGKLTQSIPAALWQQAMLRTRRTGDWIQPFGMAGHMKLKDYLIARGVDQPFRDDWPLLCLGQEVLWVIGVGASERLRAAAGTEQYIMTFSGALPDQIQEGKP